MHTFCANSVFTLFLLLCLCFGASAGEHQRRVLATDEKELLLRESALQDWFQQRHPLVVVGLQTGNRSAEKWIGSALSKQQQQRKAAASFAARWEQLVGLNAQEESSSCGLCTSAVNYLRPLVILAESRALYQFLYQACASVREPSLINLVLFIWTW
jgi:hypothetical protein